MDAVQRWVLKTLLDDGIACDPRGMSTRELMGVGFTLLDPRARRIASLARKWNEALAVGEFAWHVGGHDAVDAISHYAPIWRRFSEDGVYIRGSCYGRRIFHRERDGALSQWDRLVALLEHDPSSRRAVLSVMLEPDAALDPLSPDVPCVTTCQFLLRDGRVNAIVTMRSNDAIWGLPYDAFLFTMVQEMLAIRLGMDLGSYTHFAGSMHLYDRHLLKARAIVAEPEAPCDPMAPMTSLDGLPEFLLVERELRTSGSSRRTLDAYWRSLSQSLFEFALRPIAA